MLRAIDEGVGIVLNALEDAGIEEETLVIFTTEHGLAMPRAKGTVCDPGIEGVLLLRCPGLIEEGIRYPELVSNVDVLPTVLGLVGETVPDRVSGRSFLPLLEDREHTGRSELFAEMTWHDTYNPMRAIRTQRFKYIRNFWHLPEIYMSNDVSHSPSGEVVKNEFNRPGRDYEQLFDLEADPHERENVVSDPNYKEVATDLREQLREWMQTTEDPILDGPVPPGDFEKIMGWPPN
jgi:N-sulfoglucosamine sulfohydrolase